MSWKGVLLEANLKKKLLYLLYGAVNAFNSSLTLNSKKRERERENFLSFIFPSNPSLTIATPISLLGL